MPLSREAQKRPQGGTGAENARAHLKAFVNRRRDPDSKKEAVLRTAVRLFLDRGYWHTSLNEVAEKLNITKPALYHYFQSKEEIYLECYRWGISLIEAKLDRIRLEGGTGLQKVARFIHGYAVVIASDFGRCVVRQDDRQDDHELSAKGRAEIRGYKRAIDNCLRSFIEEGVSDGSVRVGDVRLSSFAIAGALNSIALWFEPVGDLRAEQVAAGFAEILTQGVAKRRGEKLRFDEEFTMPEGALGRMAKPAKTKTGIEL